MWLRRGFPRSTITTIIVSITGLQNGKACIDEHASISAVMSDASTITAYKWGSTSGGSEYGTGANPTDFEASDGGLLYLEATTAAGTFSATTPVRYAEPEFTTQPTLSGATFNVGSTVTFAEGVAAPSSTLSVIEFSLDGVDKTGELVGNAWDSSGENIYGAEGEIALQIRATNTGGETDSLRVTATLRDVPQPFASSDWSLSSSGAGTADVTISDLPDNGNSGITDIEYRANGDEWISSGGVGSFAITGLGAGSTDIEIRAINGAGGGATSDVKVITISGAGVARTIDAVEVGTLSSGEIPITIRSDDAQDGDTVKWVLQNTGQTAPTSSEVDAGSAGSGASLLDSGSFSWSNAEFDDQIVDGIARQNADLFVIINTGVFSNVGSATNFLIDTTAPALSAPTGAQTSATTADGSVTSDDAQGVIYAGVWPASANPGDAAVKAGTGSAYHTSDNTPTAGVNNFAATGLSPETDYKWFFVQEDDFLVRGSVVSSATFTTPVSAGGNFAGVTPSSTGLYALANEATAAISQTFAVENAPDTRVIVAVFTRSGRNDITCDVGGVSAGTALVNAEASAAQVLLFTREVSNVASVAVDVTTSNSSLDDCGIMVFHARDCVPGTPQSDTAGAQAQSVTLSPSAASSVIAIGAANNTDVGGVGIGVTLDEYDTTWAGGDYIAAGHVDSVAGGAASYGVNWGATPGNAAIAAIEVSQA